MENLLGVIQHLFSGKIHSTLQLLVFVQLVEYIYHIDLHFLVNKRNVVLETIQSDGRT